MEALSHLTDLPANATLRLAEHVVSANIIRPAPLTAALMGGPPPSLGRAAALRALLRRPLLVLLMLLR